MKKRVDYKKYIAVVSLFFSVCIVVFILLATLEHRHATSLTNRKLEAILEEVTRRYGDISKEDLIDIINSKEAQTSFAREFGIDIEKEATIGEIDSHFKVYLLSGTSCFLLALLIAIYAFYRFHKKTDENVKEITRLIEQINHKNYKLDIDGNADDELSILKNEIYKTTIMLKEQAENSMKDKSELKDSLSDISHQLKTPLTSIMIMIDNLLDDPEMDQDTREDFIRDIKREIGNINFFVQTILKLSKLDSNTVTFLKEDTTVSTILSESLKKVSSLIDLKNIDVAINGSIEGKMRCDLKWQTEAITNIIKNCIEHSDDGAKLEIFLEENKVYSSIKIKDYGKGIDAQDLPHIFEKFYRGKNAAKDSIGIGLALSKTIIESENGRIGVTSGEDGTEFVIKYFKE